MAFKLKNRNPTKTALALMIFLAGCASTPRLYLQYGQDLKQSDLERVLAENPLGAAENIKITTLGRTQGVSHHVVQVRNREIPHIHRFHDGTVVMFRGRGYMMMENQKIDLSQGDVVHIPRGVVHFFVNTGGAPAVAFVVFSPPFDGKDMVPIGKP